MNEKMRNLECMMRSVSIIVIQKGYEILYCVFVYVSVEC